jgi:hypothetical protein
VRDKGPFAAAGVRAANSTVRRQMTRALIITAVTLVVAACVARTPMPDPNGYLAVKRVEGCGTPVGNGQLRYRNVVLGQELASTLLGMLKARNFGPPLCWKLRSDGLLSLDAGPFCEPEVSASFREQDSRWRVESEDDDPLVMCHERAR